MYKLRITTICFLIFISANSQEVEKFNIEQINNISQEIVQEQARLKEELKNLQENTDNEDKLREILAEANKAKYKSAINNLDKRYDAGQKIIHHIIKETNSFNSSFSLLVLQTQFSKLIDPTTYSEFNSSMNSTLELLGDRKPYPKVNDINTMKNEIPGLDNPLITTGLSIASFFLAKYHKKKDLEEKNFRSMTCVLSFTNQTKKEYDLIVSRLMDVSARLNSYNKASKIFFSNYLTEVGFSEGYNDNYPDRLGSIESIKKDFFQNLTSEESQIGFIPYESINDDKITYQIEQVKFLMNEYELILLEIDGFIESYDVFIKNVKLKSNSICEGLNIETALIFTEIEKQLEIVQDNFDTVYKENRIASLTKRTLFGFN
ncbi:hypothetical protein [uncultured Dokdonia sp.]|uniref:hypothetical protein n=1 Tax=uncultured Dokdonia sp. TaxID=575653 RepID=UPI00261EBF6F|nr:hypothetical protein [uncultured Dokdonia sp.]